MKGRRKRIHYKKERVILSDVLPFEIPVTYSNRHLYDFLVDNKIQVVGNTISWDKSDPVLNEVINLMFGNPKVFITIPFNFKISHKENDFRELTIIHPKNQLKVVDFYEKYKHLILYYCTISEFSIRRPYRVAKFVFIDDRTHKTKLSKNQGQEVAERYDKEYENLKSFFTYKDHNNIYKFYESPHYHNCEKKFNALLKFDISKCFDSIYTHTIDWAIFNKEIVKSALPTPYRTFGREFDDLMQKLNYNETHGIVIGPEFSRIFAEIILQSIDKKVFQELKDKKNKINKTDYEVLRYVDDYFVFYNDDDTKELVISTFRHHLKEFKLYISDSKTISYDKPIITDVTIAKQKIEELLRKYLEATIVDGKIRIDDAEDQDDEPEIASFSGQININSKKLIVKFKTIIRESQVHYRDILNYTLALIERKFTKFLELQSREDVHVSEKDIARYLDGLLEFTFFLYSVSPRVNTTIRLCRILHLLTDFVGNEKRVNTFDLKQLIFKKIFDEIQITLKKNRSTRHFQVETLYLLIALRQLGSEYWLAEDTLMSYFAIKDGKLSPDNSLNYLSITVLLFYIENKKRYGRLRALILEEIKNKFKIVAQSDRVKHSELVLLLFDCLSCPFIDVLFKRELLVLHDVTDASLQSKIIDFRKYWGTKWTKFDFGKELDSKLSREVY